jgi:hypothetical protein
LSKPLAGKKDTALAAAEFHKLIFRVWGPFCWLHRAKSPTSQVRASDAAHIIKRSRMGAKLAYASFEFARPLCRECHLKQEPGLDPMFWFPYADELAAYREHNRIAKSPLPLPEPRKDAWKP